MKLQSLGEHGGKGRRQWLDNWGRVFVDTENCLWRSGHAAENLKRRASSNELLWPWQSSWSLQKACQRSRELRRVGTCWLAWFWQGGYRPGFRRSQSHRCLQYTAGNKRITTPTLILRYWLTALTTQQDFHNRRCVFTLTTFCSTMIPWSRAAGLVNLKPTPHPIISRTITKRDAMAAAMCSDCLLIFNAAYSIPCLMISTVFQWIMARSSPYLPRES